MESNFTDGKLSVQEENSFVFPRVLSINVVSMESVLDSDHSDHRQKDSIFETKHQLDWCSLGQSSLICYLYKMPIQSSK